MKLTSEQWKKGISNSHYTGVANLRNVRIDDEGVLRVINKPQRVADVDGKVLEVRKGYYDVSNDWYALTDSNTSDNGSLYNSKDSSLIQASDPLSGGVAYRNYFIPFPSVPNTDTGYFEDTTPDGNFDTYENNWETLVTKGQTQSKFTQQMSPVDGGSTTSMITDNLFVIEISNVAYIKSIDGSTNITIDNSSYTTPIQDVVKVSSTAVGVITKNMIYVYNLLGVELATLAHDFTNGDSLEHLESRFYKDNEFVVLNYTEDTDDNEGLLRFRVYEFNGTDTLVQDSQETVWSGSDGEVLGDDPHIAVIDEEDVAVIYSREGIPYVLVFEGSSWTERVNISFEYKYYGNIEGYGNGFIMLGDITSLWSYDDSADVLSLVDDTIIAPNDIRSVGANGNFFAMKVGNTYGVWKFITSQVEYTPSLVSIDGFIYYANGNSVGVIQETVQQTFDPENPATYFINNDALDLPLSTKITAIADIGRYLAIGTATGKIYFWDRTSASYEIPVNIGESIASMKSKNNILYIGTQGAGNVYLANLSSYEKNRSFSSLTSYRFDSIVGGIDFFDNGAYMGAKVNNDATLTGIWVYENGAWTLIGTDEQVTSIGKSSPNIVVFSTLNGIFELDISGTASAEWSDDEAYVVSQMERVGSVKNKSHSGNYQIYFDAPFKSSEYVKLYNRTTTNGEWQHIQTITSEQLVADSGLFAFTGQLSVAKTEQVQYKIVLNTTAGLWLFDTE